MRTCCGIVPDTSSPAMATIRERYRITLGIGISATRSDTRNCRRHGSRTFGGIRQAALFECLSPTRYLGKKDSRGTLAGRCNPKDATARARLAHRQKTAGTCCKAAAVRPRDPTPNMAKTFVSRLEWDPRERYAWVGFRIVKELLRLGGMSSRR